MRAKKRGVPFDLTVEDIVIPSHCPCLNIPLKKGIGERTDNSPSIDCIIPELGYVKTNVQVISWRANHLKSDGTREELRKVADFYNSIGETSTAP